MLVKEDFLNRLRQFFGLNLYEVRIWTALLSRGMSTAGELSDIGNVPRSRAYDILESLEKKGFVVMKLGKPIKYLAVEPVEVVDRVKKLLMVNAQERVKRLDELRTTDVLNELVQLYKTGIEFVEPTDLSGALRGRQNLYTHLESLIKNATKSVDLMTTSKGLIREVEVLRPELEKLKKKGIKVRVASNINAESLNAAKEMAKVADVRSLDKISARFAIIDDKELLFMLMDDSDVHPTYDVGVWVRTPFFAGALSQLYDLAWKEMTPLSKVK